MIKKFLMVGFFVLLISRIFAAAPTSTADRIKVEGVSGNTQVVVTDRVPVFSWDFTFSDNTEQDIVEIQVGTAAAGSDVWDFRDTVLFSYKIYNGSAVLQSNTTYYWKIRITNTDSEVSDWISSTFHTISASVSLSSSKADLKIDWNNPFNPYRGEITKVRYQLIDSNEEVAVRIYTINGELVKTLADHLAQKNAVYTVDWDGRNADGKLVASGVYIVNMKAGTSIQKTTRVVVIK